MYTLYGIKTCDTVKKARQWLDQNGLAYQFHDYRIDGLTPQQLNNFAEHLDWTVLLNKSSTSWRQLMLNNPTLIKRPILEVDDRLLIGFKADTYKTELL